MRDKDSKQGLKLEVLTHYGVGGCTCVNCGFSDIRALCIDHIEARVKINRLEKRRAGNSLYRWLRDNKYPKGFQTLCMNCNFIKSQENNERRISKEERLQYQQLRKEKRLSHYKQNLLKDSSPRGIAYFRDYIDKSKWVRMSLSNIYEDLRLNIREKNLLRVTFLKLTSEGKAKRIGRGAYEKLIPSVNC